MKVAYTDDAEDVVIILSRKESGLLVETLASAMQHKVMGKRSAAFKLAQKLEDELP